MDAVTVLADAFARAHGDAERAVDGLEVDALCWQPDPAANTIAWLVWHLARVEDHHVAEVAGRAQVWDADGWAPRFGLPDGAPDTGFGHGPDEVRSVRPADAGTVAAYLAAVAERTRALLDDTAATDLDRVVDEAWDPPVTLGVRLVSVIDDGIQHAGQAAYVRGLWERR